MSKNNQAEDNAAELKFEFTNIVTEEIGFNELFASQIAEALVRGLRKHYGGRKLYIPAPDKAERNAAIKAEFNGRNHESVCHRYSISRTTLYEIIGSK